MAELSVKIEIIEKEDVKIYRMATLDLQNNPILWVSAYLIDGLLIDCGHQHAKNEFIKRLDLKNVEKVILSHHHEDHVGACFDLIRKYKYPIYSNKETCFLLLPKIVIPPERMLTWGVHKPFKASLLKTPDYIKTSKGNF
ncbi:MAG: MBL fold metallo-hydrolase, partial [Candidatus Lokiarchaeota archaeon]|nr:MBL fold metallo-hydrolase [Candidatus Lokiarchaeota archaeon]